VLQGGRIEQIGKPLELYNAPDNLFVAGFIGSPRMNLLPARASGHDAVVLGEVGQRVETGHPIGLGEGAAMTLGIRPEHIVLAAPDEPGLAITVDLVERLGGESYLYGSIAGLPQITLRLDGQTVYGRGDSVALRFPPKHLHLFGETGQVLRGSRV
jgi:multiple sugar transport system ATP-binding protein